MLFLAAFFLFGTQAVYAVQPPPPAKLADRLTVIRSQIVGLEQGLIESFKTQKQARANVKKIKQLLKLQNQERDLGQKRLDELESTVRELGARRQSLQERIQTRQSAMRKSLIAIEGSGQDMHLPEQERLEAPHRKVLANLVDHGLKEVEVLRVDLADSERLAEKIQEEKQQLAYLFQDLNEQESVLHLNEQLQSDLWRKKQEERVAQLENYRKLKSAQSQVEQMITQFNAKLELQSTFASLKGKLPLPASGSVISSFGRAFDPKSQLYIFKKGIDIATGKKQPVHAVSAGKIAFSGELPDYGQVTIIDHGGHFYSLCAHLGELEKKAGDAVAAGDTIGLTDNSGTPIYFEIRARNVAVNPLQWISN